jgi:hypothetical protein
MTITEEGPIYNNEPDTSQLRVKDEDLVDPASEIALSTRSGKVHSVVVQDSRVSLVLVGRIVIVSTFRGSAAGQD